MAREQRAAWVEQHLPKTALMLDIGGGLARASSHIGNGNGSIARPASPASAPSLPAVPAPTPKPSAKKTCRSCGSVFEHRKFAGNTLYCDRCKVTRRVALRNCRDCGRPFRERHQWRCSDCRARRAAPQPRRSRPCSDCSKCVEPHGSRDLYCEACRLCRHPKGKPYRTQMAERVCLQCGATYQP